MSYKMNKEKLFESHKIKDLKDMLAQTVTRYPDHTAFMYKDKGSFQKITYRQFLDDVNGFGTQLIEEGYQNQFIGVMGENSYQWCVTYLTVVTGVGVIVPLDKELSKEEMLYLANESQMKVLVYSEKQKEKVAYLKQHSESIQIYISMEKELNQYITKGKQRITQNDTRFVEADIDIHKMSILLFTSGTTGVSKGVMLCHENIMVELYGISKIVNLNDQDTLLSILPLHHTYECTCGFLSVIYKGGAIAFSEGIRYIAQNIKEVRPTKLVLVPLILESIYEKIQKQAKSSFLKKMIFNTMLFVSGKLSYEKRKKIFQKVHVLFGERLNQVICGASALSPKVSKHFDAMGIQVLQGYGLTECAPIATGNRQFAYKHGSIGLALPGVDVKIDQPDEKGIGEIIIHGKNVMLGYYNNPEATSKTIKNDWLHTGDIGYEDKDGFFYITGRMKNLIVTKTGKNIFPEELESKLNESPFILEAIVSGSEDDITKEDSIKAYIVPRIDAIKEKFGNMPSMDEIKKLIDEEVKRINKKLPIFKRIKNIVIKDEEFEKTTTKKIKRHKVPKE